MLGRPGLADSDFFLTISGSRLTAIWGTSSPSSLESFSDSSCSYNAFASSSSAIFCSRSASSLSYSLIYLKISWFVFFLWAAILYTTTVILAQKRIPKIPKIPMAIPSAVPTDSFSTDFLFIVLEASTVCYSNRWAVHLVDKIEMNARCSYSKRRKEIFVLCTFILKNAINLILSD